MKTSVCSLLVVFGLMLAGCFPIPPLYCTDQTPCGTKTGAVCVLSEGMPGACALPDDTCPSKYRYYKDSGFGRDNKCADLPTFELQSLPASVDEHQIFSMHAVIKDGSGQKITNYKGNPTISAEWGDARVFSFSGFTNGEADYTLWVNRETNAKDGPERLNVKDGNTVGRSGGVNVTVKPWKLKSKSTAFDIEGKGLIVSQENGYFLIYSKGGDAAQRSLQRATTSNLRLNFWTTFATPIMDIANIPWQAQKLYPSGIVKIDGKYLLSYTTYAYFDQKFFYATGLATSTDSVTWTNLSKKPMGLTEVSGDPKCAVIEKGSIILESENKIRIFYTNPTAREFTCTAESVDQGTTWTNAILIKTPMTPFFIAKESSVYRAIDYSYKSFTSRDGINWVLSSAPGENADISSLFWSEEFGMYLGLDGSDSALKIYTREN